MDAFESVFPHFFQLRRFDGDFLQRLTSAERFRPDGSDSFSDNHAFQLFAVFKRSCIYLRDRISFSIDFHLIWYRNFSDVFACRSGVGYFAISQPCVSTAGNSFLFAFLYFFYCRNDGDILRRLDSWNFLFIPAAVSVQCDKFMPIFSAYA